MNGRRPPVHDSLEVVAYEDIYRNEEWWKSVVNYLHEGAETPEITVYLWHRDDAAEDWTRKNKYVIKTTEAWETDKAVIKSLLTNNLEESETMDFPVSDYYTVGTGTTVFQSDGWWKAIVKIVEKGSYETEEIVVYLWQRRDGEWRRRQKYTVKSEEQWQTDVKAISALLESQDRSETPAVEEAKEQGSEDDVTTTSEDGVVGEIKALDEELEAHLSEATQKNS